MSDVLQIPEMPFEAKITWPGYQLTLEKGDEMLAEVFMDGYLKLYVRKPGRDANSMFYIPQDSFRDCLSAPFIEYLSKEIELNLITGREGQPVFDALEIVHITRSETKMLSLTLADRYLLRKFIEFVKHYQSL